VLKSVGRELKLDRDHRKEMAGEELILDADDHFASHVAHLRTSILPATAEQTKTLIAKIEDLNEAILRIEGEIARIPEADRIAVTQRKLDEARAAHQKKIAELEVHRVRIQALQNQRRDAENRLDSFGTREMEDRFAHDIRERIITHSQRVRKTLEQFRQRIVARHTKRIESLMLESFQKLLSKAALVRDLTIDPKSFAVTLTGRDGKILPFERLSAGERQILATSLLWGLARASGRPVPTVIDTPLGRLDSSHRRHLVERYFPDASHQVLLLSTDEEIVGDYLKSIKPFVARSYLLAHDDQLGSTQAQKGYFPTYETAS
jgi:DNA sulfur modification protein DndD